MCIRDSSRTCDLSYCPPTAAPGVLCAPRSKEYTGGPATLPFRLQHHLLYTDSLDQDTNTWIDRLRSGDARALARAISTVENRAAGWSELLKALFPHTGKARVLGLTGAPGSGKSTLVDQLAKH